MSGLLEKVKRKVDASYFEVEEIIRKDKVKVDFTDGPARKNRIVIDMDEYQKTITTSASGPRSRRTDLLLISDCFEKTKWVVPIELKKGKAIASDVRDQLRSGARAAQDIVECAEKVTFLPLLISGGLHKGARKAFQEKKNRVKFCGQKWHIYPLGTDQKVATALKRVKPKKT